MAERVISDPIEWPSTLAIPSGQLCEKPRQSNCSFDSCPSQIPFDGKCYLNFVVKSSSKVVTKSVKVNNQRIEAPQIFINYCNHLVKNLVNFSIRKLLPGQRLDLVSPCRPERKVQILRSIGYRDEFWRIAGLTDAGQQRERS